MTESSVFVLLHPIYKYYCIRYIGILDTSRLNRKILFQLSTEVVKSKN